MSKDFYDGYWEKNKAPAGIFDAPPNWSDENLSWHIEFFRPFVKGAVLDLGAGEGTFSSALRKALPAITESRCGEISDEAIKRGKEKYPDLLFSQEDITHLSFGDETFDTVCAIEVLEHLLDIDRCIAEIRRVLKPGGHFCLTTTDFNLLKQLVIAGFFFEKYFYATNPHIRFFTGRTLEELLKRHGFIRVAYRWNKSYYGLMPKGQMAVFRKEGA